MNAFGFVNPAETILDRMAAVTADEMAVGGDNEILILRHLRSFPEMSDTRRAQILGISKMTVQKWRSKAGIPAYTHKKCGQCGETKHTNAYSNADHGDGYKAICNICLNRPEAWYTEVEQLLRGAGW